VYDLSKAQRLLGWQPAYNFEQWFAEYASGPPACDGRAVARPRG
jgi:hypothetical protein